MKTMMTVGKAYKTNQFTAGTDDVHPRAKAVADVNDVNVILKPTSSMVSSTLKTRSFWGSVRANEPEIMKASSSPMPEATIGIQSGEKHVSEISILD